MSNIEQIIRQRYQELADDVSGFIEYIDDTGSVYSIRWTRDLARTVSLMKQWSNKGVRFPNGRSRYNAELGRRTVWRQPPEKLADIRTYIYDEEDLSYSAGYLQSIKETAMERNISPLEAIEHITNEKLLEDNLTSVLEAEGITIEEWHSIKELLPTIRSLAFAQDTEDETQCEQVTTHGLTDQSCDLSEKPVFQESGCVV